MRMAKKINLTTVPPDKSIMLEVGGLFYQRLNSLLIHYSDSLGKDKLLASLEKVKRGITQNDPVAFNLETLLILIRDIEKEFQNKGCMVVSQIDLDDLPQMNKE